MNAPAPVDGTTQVMTREYLEEQRQALRESVARGASDAQLEQFIHLCTAYDLDPFRREIYFSSDLGILTGRDGLRKIASRNPAFVACRSGAVYAEDEFELEQTMGADGELIVSTFRHRPNVFNRKTLIGAWALVQMANQPTDVVFAPLAQYRRNSGPWTKQTDAMIRKCAETVVLRAACHITGLYTGEEMEGEDAPLEPVPMTVTEEPVEEPVEEPTNTATEDAPPYVEPAPTTEETPPPEPGPATAGTPRSIDGTLIAELMEDLAVCTDDTNHHDAVVQRRQLQMRVRSIYAQMRVIAVKRMGEVLGAGISMKQFETLLRGKSSELSRRGIEILIRLCVDGSMWDDCNQSELAALWADHITEAA